ncbi:MAG: alpha-ketoglutarate-dependent dioxygenase AlkB [Pseudomonadota bacterium]|nr:alpha-ketoglutarate-dependent dioxygenase AlkB [Pseudomonadota bacterium]
MIRASRSATVALESGALSRPRRSPVVLAGTGRINLPDARIDYIPGFLCRDAADELLTFLLETVEWHQPTIRIYGKQVLSPRLAAWYGDHGAVYRYSGLVNCPLPWLMPLLTLRRRLYREWHWNPNAVLLNYYRDGRDSMGWHSDDEAELGRQPAVASISVGATRRFLIRHRRDKNSPVYQLDLEHGSLLFMSGTTQRYWRHSVPKTTTVIGPRINLTFRKIEQVKFGCQN